MMRLARVFTVMSVCLWAQSGWACSAGCIAGFERTTAMVYLAVAVSVGSSSYILSKSFGASKKDEKPEVWVFDWHIVKKIQANKNTKNYLRKTQ